MFGFSDTLYNLTICEIEVICVEPSNCQQFLNMLYKRVCRNCPISSCRAKYPVTLANLLGHVHQLEHIQWGKYLQGAKVQPKVKVVIYESEADNSGKKISQIVLKETVYELSRSRRKEAFFKQKLKEQLKRTRQSERNKESRTLGLEAIGKCVDTEGLFIIAQNRTEKTNL